MTYNYKPHLYVALLLVFFSSVNLSAQDLTPKAEASKLMEEIGVSLKEKNFDDVIVKSTRILELFPKSGDVYVTRAMAYQFKGEKDKALTDYSAALTLSINPKLEIAAHQMRGMLLYQSKRYTDGIKDFDFLVEKEPAEVNHLVFRGWCHLYSGEYKLAIADFDGALKIDPGKLETRRFRASANLSLGNYEKAIEDVNEELRINPKPKPENYKIRGLAYRKLGKTEQADADEQKFTELSKTSSNAQSRDPR